ncbi:MAG: sugar phosphate isomerase/epimerase family protein [Planctomycetota bacterium]|jgi:sugar phosphate isomerase/epimerase
MNRRDFISQATITAGAVITGSAVAACAPTTPTADTTEKRPARSNSLYEISLAQWSLHRALRDGSLDALDFAKYTRETFDVDAIEYVNSFFKDRARDEDYLAQLERRANDHGVKSLLIMVDGEGALGDPDAKQRTEAIENHHRWVEAAKRLGCHSIRVNARSDGTPDEQERLAAEGLRRLCEFADPYGIDVIVENHGGISSNGAWLAAVMRRVDHERCGTLPDFGNFRIDDDTVYDRYKGVRELMPYAKAVSAKSNDFDESGNEIHTDFEKMMRIVLDAGYRGWVGIEYEGDKASEDAGIIATRDLLKRVRETLSAEYTTTTS